MRTIEEICELFSLDDNAGAALLRSRDSLQKALQCSQEEIAAVEDYIFALCLSLGRDAHNSWRVSPLILYGSLIIMVGFQELSDAMAHAVSVWQGMRPPRDGPLVETYRPFAQPQE